MNNDFNPLHREGGDAKDDNLRYFESISIHSTARVETPSFILCHCCSQFQSTPPRGWRPRSSNCWSSSWLFQSTPPRGWRLGVISNLANANDFNPLHREGGDDEYVAELVRLELFQSTPPRGWRRFIANESLSIVEFQSTPPRGWRLHDSLMNGTSI